MNDDLENKVRKYDVSINFNGENMSTILKMKLLERDVLNEQILIMKEIRV